MTHPTHPLFMEERIEIVTSPNSQTVMLEIQQTFAQRRNVEFPGWHEKYAKEVGEWLAWQKKPKQRRPRTD